MYSPIWVADMEICSKIHSWRAVASSGRHIALWLFSSWHQCWILRLAVWSTLRTFSGDNPIADSPDNIKTSPLYLTASETSATSAQMGVGNTQSWTPTIVMTPITGLLNWQHKHTIWCTDETCSSGIWAPRSPHAMLHLPPVLCVLQILQRIPALCFGQHIGWLVKMRGGTLRNHPTWENQLALWVPTIVILHGTQVQNGGSWQRIYPSGDLAVM